MSFDKLSGLSFPSSTSGITPSDFFVPVEKSSSGPLHGASLTIVGPTGQVEGPANQIKIELETPIIGLEDIQLDEVLKQIDSVSQAPIAVVVLASALKEVGKAADATGREMKKVDEKTSPEKYKKVEKDAAAVEEGAKTIHQSLYDIIENSTYPSFSDFLKELVMIAQKLREAATQAKLAAIEANYQTLYDASEQMVEAAEQSKESRDLELEAERTQAISQIVTGVVTIGISVVGGVAGGAQFASFLGNLTSEMSSGITTLITYNMKADSSEAQLKADLASAAKQRLEAAAKLIESQVAIADELREIGKALRDMILKLFQDFISALNQTLQRSNV